MAKRRRKKKTTQVSEIKQEIIGLVLLAVAVLLGVSMYYDQGGAFTNTLRDMCTNLFGTAAYVLPVVLGGYIIRVFSEPKEQRNYWQIIPTVFLVIMLSIHFYIVSQQEPTAGGILGVLFGKIAVDLLSVVGTYVLLGFILLIYIVQLTKKSIIKLIRTTFSKAYTGTRDVAQTAAVRIKDRVIQQDLFENSQTKKEFLYGSEDKNKKVKAHNIIINESLEESKEADLDFTDEIEQEEKEAIKIFGIDNVGGIPKNEEIEESGQIEHEISGLDSEEVRQSGGQGTNVGIELSFCPPESQEHKLVDTQGRNTSFTDENQKIKYRFPSINFLCKNPNMGGTDSGKELKENAERLETTLDSFGVKAKVVQVNKGPTVTRYELQPNVGVKVSKIVNLADDIALNLAAVGVRIEAPIPGKAAIGIEVPNKNTTPVYLREVIDTKTFRDAESKLSVGLGKDIAGKEEVIDLSKMPHLLIAGSTGSGKSVCINSIITSIIYKADPNEVKLLMIDPKVVELKMYNGIPHLLIPVVTDPKKAASALQWAVAEMLNRYQTFAEANVRDIKGFNKMVREKGEDNLMPQIVIIIDELADLMMSTPREVEDAICRLAQMARAAGMHLIIATQRPSVDVITGVIKANIPSRIAFAVSSNIDSRTILDMGGAEKLLGKGDMLYHPMGESKPKRVQGAFVSDKEVEKIVDFIKQAVPVEYNKEMIEEITSRGAVAGEEGEEGDDELLEQAIDLVVEKEKASISMFQRAFRIGYNRAARLMDQLEAKGIVSGDEGTKPRRVIRD